MSNEKRRELVVRLRSMGGPDGLDPVEWATGKDIFYLAVAGMSDAEVEKAIDAAAPSPLRPSPSRKHLCGFGKKGGCRPGEIWEDDADVRLRGREPCDRKLLRELIIEAAA